MESYERELAKLVAKEFEKASSDSKPPLPQWLQAASNQLPVSSLILIFFSVAELLCSLLMLTRCLMKGQRERIQLETKHGGVAEEMARYMRPSPFNTACTPSIPSQITASVSPNHSSVETKTCVDPV